MKTAIKFRLIVYNILHVFVHGFSSILFSSSEIQEFVI